MEERAELINQLWKLIPGCSTGTDSKADRETRTWFQAALAILSIPTLRSFKNDIRALISYCKKIRARDRSPPTLVQLKLEVASTALVLTLRNADNTHQAEMFFVAFAAVFPPMKLVMVEVQSQQVS